MIDSPAAAAVQMLHTSSTMSVEEVCARWYITLPELQTACGERGHRFQKEDDGLSRKGWEVCKWCRVERESEEAPEP